jgi:4-hydroxy-4-methyl-2-oxoglutarate aldolase
LYTVYRDFKRPDPEVIKGFSKMSSPLISDAMGRINVMSSDISSLVRGLTLCGPALTVNTYTADNLMIHLAIKLSKPGDILVVNNGGHQNAGLWGELMTVSALERKIAGIVIEGGVRDIADLEQLKFPVFGRCVNPRGTFKNDPGSVNIPISCGGVALCPGDLIYGDDDGVVVVPNTKCGEVLEKAKAQQKKEAEIRARLKKGETVYDILELEQYLTGKITYHDYYPGRED